MLSEEEIINNIKKQIGNTKKANECGLATKGEFKEDIEALEGILDLYNKEKEQNRVNINSINDLMKECNEENKRCMELAIELDKEKEKNIELNRLKGFEMLDIFNMGKESSRQRIKHDWVEKDKIREKLKEYHDFFIEYPEEYRKAKLRAVEVVLKELLEEE